ncbi:MAG: DNA topoisomerase IV [Bacteroidota bacterium]
MKYLIAVLAVISLVSCYQPERNCKKFQEGTFEFETVIDGDVVKTTFIRQQDIEIEKVGEKIDTSNIRWINDCEYVLRAKNPKSISAKKAIHFKILTTNKDEYTFEYNFVGDDNKQRASARKID